jgi:hypothetical protein
MDSVREAWTDERSMTAMMITGFVGLAALIVTHS